MEAAFVAKRLDRLDRRHYSGWSAMSVSPVEALARVHAFLALGHQCYTEPAAQAARAKTKSATRLRYGSPTGEGTANCD
jgi:hypothetical protein